MVGSPARIFVSDETKWPGWIVFVWDRIQKLASLPSPQSPDTSWCRAPQAHFPLPFSPVIHSNFLFLAISNSVRSLTRMEASQQSHRALQVRCYDCIHPQDTTYDMPPTYVESESYGTTFLNPQYQAREMAQSNNQVYSGSGDIQHDASGQNVAESHLSQSSIPISVPPNKTEKTSIYSVIAKWCDGQEKMKERKKKDRRAAHEQYLNWVGYILSLCPTAQEKRITRVKIRCKKRLSIFHIALIAMTGPDAIGMVAGKLCQIHDTSDCYCIRFYHEKEQRDSVIDLVAFYRFSGMRQSAGKHECEMHGCRSATVDACMMEDAGGMSI